MAWQLQEAKNKFSEVVERALHEGPQTVTRHGKPVVVVVSASEFNAVNVQETLSAILQDCPVEDWGATRSKDTGRTIRFD